MQQRDLLIAEILQHLCRLRHVIIGIQLRPNSVKQIRPLRTGTEEFSLINKYNAFVLGLSTDEADKTEYENYLKEVLAVKAMVRADLAAAGIDVGAAGI